MQSVYEFTYSKKHGNFVSELVAVFHNVDEAASWLSKKRKYYFSPSLVNSQHFKLFDPTGHCYDSEAFECLDTVIRIETSKTTRQIHTFSVIWSGKTSPMLEDIVLM